MKNRISWIVLVIGILLGAFFVRFAQEWQDLKQPITTDQNFSLKEFMDNFVNNISVDDISFVDEKYQRFEEVLLLLEDAYYDNDKIQSGAMLESAIKAFVDAIEDPYTVYLDAEQQSGFVQDLKGEEDFEGIGAVVRKKDYFVLVEELIKDSPAFQAGVQPLDRIIAVDSGSVKDLDINEAVDKIKGPAGTDVVLTIERVDRSDESIKQYLEITVTRDKMQIPSVSSKILTGNDGEKIGYIEISIIGEETENLLEENIVELQRERIDAVILDLRGNGGGLLPIAVQISSHFVPKNEIVTSARYRVLADEVYKSQGYGTLEGLPVVVLVDYYTASAGEIISLALQEQAGAEIVGETTFGKGSIQTLYEFDDGASIKYTIGKRYAPSGKNIDEIGVSPDVEVEFDPDAYLNSGVDNQLDRAIEILDGM